MTFPTETATFDGTELLVRAGTFDHEMAREIFEDHYYTCDGWDIPDGARVLDIGGGIGAFAVYAATHGASEVHTFEPVPESFDLLAKNCAAYPVIQAEPFAVATEAGAVLMSGFEPMPDGTINTGYPTISERGDLEVLAVDIHDVLARCDQWDVLKLDIEGYEYELLRAFTADEFAKVDVITMEFHHGREDTAHARGIALGWDLKAHGFTVEVDYAWGQQGRLRARR